MNPCSFSPLLSELHADGIDDFLAVQYLQKVRYKVIDCISYVRSHFMPLIVKNTFDSGFCRFLLSFAGCFEAIDES